MKVLLKSFKELEEEYDIEKVDFAYMLATHGASQDINNLLGTIVDARYDKETNTFIIKGYQFTSDLIKGIVTKEEYTIKRLSDSFEYTISF